MIKLISKIVKFLFALIIGYVLLCLLTPCIPFAANKSSEHQINYISKCLEGVRGLNLQSKYPEGLMFGNCIFGLGIIDFLSKNEDKVILYQPIIESCISRVLSEESQQVFQTKLILPKGAFYNGWTNFLLKEYISSNAFQFSKNQNYYVSLHDSISEIMINLQKDSLQVFETYFKASWPADNLACIASLDNKYSEIKIDWLELIRSHSSQPLIHHDYFNKDLFRGCSQALILYFLSKIDMNLAKSQNEIFQQKLAVKFLGIELISEGFEEGEDIDSGPVVFGLGSVATIVNVKAQKSILKNNMKPTLSVLNTIGIPVHTPKSKFYLFQQELIYDIFLFWVMN